MAKPKNSIIYSGPSMIDGKPIIVVCIVKSGNIKTGNMLQTHIIRADINPLEASRTGADVSICGTCTHRGTPTEKPGKKTAEARTCYVNLGQGPNQVFKAYSAGKYPIATPEQTQEMGRARMVRLGTYGDPAAAPAHVWENLLKYSEGHTGYTHQHSLIAHSHQHNSKTAPDYTRLMYSADTKAEAVQAHSKGYRTFRVIPVADYKTNGKAAILSNEILCPASKENDRAVTCTQCKLCSGSDLGKAKTSTGSNSKAKSIAIVAHGTARNKVV